MPEETVPPGAPEPPEEMPPNYARVMQHMKEAELAASEYPDSGIKAAINHRPTITEQLLHQKAYHEAELKRINEALAHALANVPTMALLDSIEKTGIHRR